LPALGQSLSFEGRLSGCLRVLVFFMRIFVGWMLEAEELLFGAALLLSGLHLPQVKVRTVVLVFGLD
jgi:hypothetical protein